MARQVAKFGLVILIASACNAFKLKFRDNSRCAGEFLGTWVGGVDQGCRQDFLGVVQSVIIDSTGKVDDPYTVKFYTSPDCTSGTEIATGNTGCLTVDSVVVQAYRSFNVVLNSIDCPVKKRPRAPPGQWGLAQRERVPQPSITHGQLATFQGIEYKWQQVNAKGWIGILPHEWDDSVHVANNTVIEADPDLARELDLIAAAQRNRGLEDRSLVSGLCQVSATCLSAAQTAAEAVVAPFVAAYFSDAAVTARARGVQFNALLNRNPFITQLGIQVGATFVQVMMGGKTSGNNNNIADCSNLATSLSEQARAIDALAPAIQSLASSSTCKSLTAAIQDTRGGGDIISTVTTTVLACGQFAETTGCSGVDAGFCTA